MPTLENGLKLRTAASADDVERAAAFSGEIHGELVTGLTRALFTHHPHTSLDDLIFVEDEESGQVVSSLCLIPWTWHCDGVEIPSGEMGIVGTLEAYRHRGLIRAQVDLFKQCLRERGCLLSQIQGIPYFYRQFGYEYALPLEGGLRLELRHAPEPPDPPFGFRLATVDDLPTLARIYEEAAGDLAIHTARDEATWRYLLIHAADTEMVRETWIVEGPGGQVAGYFCLPEHGFGEEQIVNEVSRLSFDAARAVLNQVKELAVERGKPGIRLNLPAGCTLARLARSLEAYDMGTYAWQIHVPDITALLRALAPVFERRIAASPFAGLTEDVRIGLFRETILLRFIEGRVKEVTNLGFTGWEGIHFPPTAFTPLVLGHRTWKELNDVYPDAHVVPARRLLVDALFPRMPAFLYTNY